MRGTPSTRERTLILSRLISLTLPSLQLSKLSIPPCYLLPRTTSLSIPTERSRGCRHSGGDTKREKLRDVDVRRLRYKSRSTRKPKRKERLVRLLLWNPRRRAAWVRMLAASEERKVKKLQISLQPR
mmetsp:Transcript_43246/g.108051  ORF Transcript_43246/g.108051 Transcript_43246/m.108051 type:complete len:127 (-) Transcript_43246:276-656(-)